MPRHAQKHSLKLTHAVPRTQRLALKVLNAEDSLMKDQQLAAKIHPVERLMPRHAQKHSLMDQQLAAKIHPAERLMPRHAQKHSLKLTHAVPRTQRLALKVLNAEDSHLNQLHAAKIHPAERLMPRHAQKHSLKLIHA